MLSSDSTEGRIRSQLGTVGRCVMSQECVLRGPAAPKAICQFMKRLNRLRRGSLKWREDELQVRQAYLCERRLLINCIQQISEAISPWTLHSALTPQ